MNSEILELSQWLFDKGFEPDMWHAGVCHEQDDYEYDTHYKQSQIISTCKRFPCEDTNYSFDINTPYFTLGRALELLPYTIESFDLEFSKRREYLAYVKHVSDSEIYYHKCQVTWIRKREIDYHLAALRLLKKVVEEGYVKVN